MLIDTNVWSETGKRRPERRVVDWLSANIDAAVLSTLVIGEMQRGIALANDPRHRERLEDQLFGVRELIGTRILPFDDASALAWGELVARLEKTGRPIGDLDTLIAAQALAHGLPVVTRNIHDFEPTGVRIVNPWIV